MRFTSQLINDISRVLQTLLKYFNGTIISISFMLPSAGAFCVIFNLDLNDSESVKLSRAHLCNIAINFQMLWNNYWHYYIIIFSITYFCIIYFTFTINKWSTIFKNCVFISVLCLPGCCIVSCSSNCFTKILFGRLGRLCLVLQAISF